MRFLRKGSWRQTVHNFLQIILYSDAKDQLQPSKASGDCLEQLPLTLLMVLQVITDNPLERNCVSWKSERGPGHQVGWLFESDVLRAAAHTIAIVVFHRPYVCLYIFFNIKNKLFCLRKILADHVSI